MAEEQKFCTCKDSEWCQCGGYPPHCQWCCLDLTPEQFAAEEKRLEEWKRGQAQK
jgi:hypothetical protein